MGKRGGNLPKRATKKHKYNDTTYAINKQKKKERAQRRAEKMRIKSAERKERKRLQKLGITEGVKIWVR